jgi:acetyltransferase-like isoleucine patch superfamily enzyme
MSRIISYRGLIANGGQDTINLHTNDGKTGYKIVKFQVIANDPKGAGSEGVVKIYSIPQTAVTDKIDFNDNTLLGCAFYENNSSQATFGGTSIIFDNVKVNQDIYITAATDESINYYFELEQVDLTEDQALVAIVKNLRNEQ